MKFLKSPLQILVILFSVSVLSFSISGFSIKRAMDRDPDLISKLGKKYQFNLEKGSFFGNSGSGHSFNFSFHNSEEEDSTKRGNGQRTRTGSEISASGKSWQFSQSFQKIKVESIAGDVVLRPGMGDQIKVLINVNSENDVENILVVESTKDEIIITEKNHLKEDAIQISIELPERKLNEFTFKTTSGDLSIENSSIEKLWVKSESGEFILSRSEARDIHFESTSGDLNFYASQCAKFIGKTVSGNFNIELDKACSLALDSVSGDAKILTSGNVPVDIRFKSISGELTNKLQLDKKSPFKIEMSSVSGNLDIK